MNPEIAAQIFKEILMTPVNELDQLPRRCGLQVSPGPDDLEHARELLRAIIVGLQSASGPNWDPVHTAWGAMVARHGAVQQSAMGPAKPTWVRDLPAKPSLGDAPPGVGGGYAQPAPQPMQPVQPQVQANPYGPPPGGPPPAAPVPMGQPPMPMQPAMGQPVMGQPYAQTPQPQAMAPQPMMPGNPVQTPAGGVPQPIPAHLRGPRKVARTEPGAPLPPPPPGREAWPQPPAALHGGGPIAAPVGFKAPDAKPVYAPADGYPAQQVIAPTPQIPVSQAPVAHGSQPGGYPAVQPGGHPSVQPSGYPGAPPGGAPSAQPQAQRAPAATSQGDDIAMNVAKYAMFCAACAAHPERVFETMVEYGVTSPTAREKLDESWQDRFDDDPTLQKQWETLFAQFRGQF